MGIIDGTASASAAAGRPDGVERQLDGGEKPASPVLVQHLTEPGQRKGVDVDFAHLLCDLPKAGLVSPGVQLDRDTSVGPHLTLAGRCSGNGSHRAARAVDRPHLRSGGQIEVDVFNATRESLERGRPSVGCTQSIAPQPPVASRRRAVPGRRDIGTPSSRATPRSGRRRRSERLWSRLAITMPVSAPPPEQRVVLRGMVLGEG